MNAPTINIVDDDPAIRRSLSMMLRAHDLPTREYATGDEFLAAFNPDLPACIILDLRMPGATGEEVLKALRQRGVHTPVIVLTGHADVAVVVRTMKLGLVDFLEKPVDHAVLIQAIRDALRNDAQRRATEERNREAVHKIGLLTPRERQMLAMLAHGKTSKEIAVELGVSVKTVDNHRAHVLAKLSASNVAELSALAVRAGLA